MADSTIAANLFTLRDNWPGKALVAHSVSAIGDSEMKNNLAAAGYNMFSKVLYYAAAGTTSIAGYSTLAYLQCHATLAATPAAGNIVGQASATVLGQVSQDGATVGGVGTRQGLAGVALAAFTASYYNWFWVGGTAPGDYVTALDSTTVYVTDGTVAAGAFGVGDRTATNCGFLVSDGTGGDCGMAIAADVP